MTAVDAQRRAPRQGCATDLLRHVRSWETNSDSTTLPWTCQTCDGLSLPLPWLEQTNETCAAGKPTDHKGKTRARPLLVRQGLRACLGLCLAVPLPPGKRHTDTETQRHTDTQTQTHTHTQHTHTDTHTQTHTHTHTQHTHTHTHTDTQTHRHTDRHKTWKRHTERHTERDTQRETHRERHTERQRQRLKRKKSTGDRVSRARATTLVLTGHRRSGGQQRGWPASVVAHCAVARAQSMSQLSQRQHSPTCPHSTSVKCTSSMGPIWKLVTTTKNELWMFTSSSDSIGVSSWSSHGG